MKRQFPLKYCLPLTIASLAAITACSQPATLPFEAGVGPDPALPEPNPGLIPTVNTAKAEQWSQGQMPTAAEGLKVNAFAQSLDHPRWLMVLPNGDVLVAETNRSEPEDAGFSLKNMVMKLVMSRAGAGAESANRISLLRDADGDGTAELKTEFLTGLHSPFGMALVDNTLYVANTDAIVAVPYETGQTRIEAKPERLVDLPGGPINHHWTKNLIADPDGKSLYVTVGSNSNVAENGMKAEKNRAAILRFDIGTKALEPFATGLRNPNGLAWDPVSGALWTAVNERDEIGSDLVPDYMTSVQQGGFYGWPYSYYGSNVDIRVEPQNPALVARALKPDYALGAHTASLGLAFADNQESLGSSFAHGAFIGQHGSWNRKPKSGYKVIFVPFDSGKPAGAPVDVLTGFLDEDEKARGRPVGVIIDSRGDLLVADDVGNTVWRVSGAR